MSLVEEYTVAQGFNPDRVSPAVNCDYFALPISRTSIGIWSFDKLQLRHKPLELNGHRKSITALALGNNGSPNLLCSCAGDYVIVWNVELCQRKFDERRQIKGEIIGTRLGEARHCAFNSDDSLVVVCVDVNAYILKSDTQETVAVLDGHTYEVTGAEFCPHYSSTVVTISSDRTFKVWNIESNSLVYQSCVITSYALVNLCMNWTKPAFSVGSADGIIRTYDLTDGNDFRTLHQLDVSSSVKKQKDAAVVQENCLTESSRTPNGRHTWKKSDAFIPSSQGLKDRGDESTSAIVGLSYAYTSSPHNENRHVPSFLQSAVTDIVSSKSTVLIVATTSALLQIDPQTLDTLDFIDLQNEIPSNSSFASKGVTLKALNYASFSYGSSVWMVAGTLFENRIHVFDWFLAPNDVSTPDGEKSPENIDAAFDLLSLCPELNPDRERITRTSELCMVATNPLCSNSLLASKLTPQAKSNSKSAPGSRQKPNSKNKKQESLNQPITFKNKIKSSGYSTMQPQGKFFQPRTAKPKQLSHKNCHSLDASLLRADYPKNIGAPNEQITKRAICESPSPILSMKFSGTGQQLAVGLANTLAMNLTLPLKKDGHVLQSHNGPVNSVCWSHDNQLLLTGSDDRSAIMWSVNSSEPLMRIANVSDNMSKRESSVLSNNDNAMFSKEVKQTQFYYMDKFILLITGNTFNMYKYHLDTTKNEIRRYLTKSKYKLVKSFTSDSVHLTSMAAVNSFYSQVAVCAGSNRSFEVYDMNVGKSTAVVEDAHSRPIHAIALNEGSAYVSQPDVAYNVFATAAVSDCIRMWDLRTQKCVQRFEGHMNKAIQCGLAFSPCAQYLASGSEDRLTYIFDVRTGTYCERLTGQSEVVSSVAFHPAKPLLVSGSLEGNVVLYKPEQWKK